MKIFIAGIALLVLLGFCIVMPIMNTKTALSQQIQETFQLIEWMKPTAQQILNARTQFSPGESLNKKQLEQAINELLKQDPLLQNMTIEPSLSDNHFLLNFSQVSFDHLMDIIQKNTPHWGWQINVFHVEQNDKAGLVSGKMTLSKGE